MIDLYLKLNWAVLPCNNKFPATPHGYKDATKDKTIFDKYPGKNIGVATGEVSGFFVLDVDIKNGAKGEESLGKLIKKHGKLPVTVEAQTWSKGKHLYFKYPKCGIKCRTNFLPGLDIRGDGGYVVVPPSEVEGQKYIWVRSPGENEIQDAPAWLISLLKESKITGAIQNDYAVISEGQRNSELTSRAGKMRAAGLEINDIFQSLLKINAKQCQPPLTEKEVRVIAESVGRYAPIDINIPFTDMWNCEKFVEKYGENIRWCDKLGGWFIWNKSYWQRDEGTIIMQWAKEFVKNLVAQADIAGDKRLKQHAIRSANVSRLNAMIELVKSEPGILTDYRTFDRDNYLLNCTNGTLNLITGELNYPKRENFITKSLTVNYVKEECPTWLKFLGEVFQNDESLIDYVQRAMGYCLSGDTSEQKFFLCCGNGRNGKSTFLKHIMYILLPDYASGTPAGTMIENENMNTMQAVAALKGMRYVILNEFDEGKNLSAAQVKNLTGGEPVVARFLYHEQFIYTPTYKFWMSTNFKPRIKDTSLGIWRRLVILPFDYTVPLEKVDPELDRKIAAEYEGILAWAVQGFQNWRKGGFPALERLKAVAETYRDDSDIIGQFLTECSDTEANPAEAEVTVVDFVKRFQGWANENGVRYPPGRTTIIDYMEKRGYGRPKLGTNRNNRSRLLWKGIGLKTDWEPTKWEDKY